MALSRIQVPPEARRGEAVEVRILIQHPMETGFRRNLEGKRVATEYVRLTENALAEKGVQADVEFSWGACEVKIAQGVADAIVAATFTRASDPNGKLGLSPGQLSLLEALARDESRRPFVAIVLGSPYVGALGAKLPAILVTYEIGDAPEAAA